MTDSGILLVLAVVAFGAWLWYRTRGGSAASAERQLRSICLGNEQQAERLIEGEMTRAPGISRAEAVRRAIARYRRDNR